MQSASPSLVDGIRNASRKLVRELGFMRPTLAGTNLSPSAVHAVIEIGRSEAVTARDLGERLNLEKSSVSRLLRRLIDADLLAVTASAEDGRAKRLALTDRGKATLSAINAFAEEQVRAALDRMPADRGSVVLNGIRVYADALEAIRRNERLSVDAAELVAGYRPGVIGRAAEMHARFYAREAGFGQFFESKVATEFAAFASRLDRPANGLWSAVYGEQIVGTVAIDGEDMGPSAAHLRWFIVADGYRGAGVGRRLLGEAVAFCDRLGFAETVLWAFRGLDAARRLYESAGFVLAEERPGNQWGREVVEQRFVRPAL
ncbi:MAG: MarR family transcriptional regulator [Rhodospirillaceae bacterium]|nr:MarR family transcriptional regulator [Rhodospirillaceae bacterium]